MRIINVLEFRHFRLGIGETSVCGCWGDHKELLAASRQVDTKGAPLSECTLHLNYSAM